MSSAFEPQNPFAPHPVNPSTPIGSGPLNHADLPANAELDGSSVYVPHPWEGPDGHGGTVRFVGRRKTGQLNEFGQYIPD